MKFDIRQTNIAKGIAVLLLLWHHLFYDSPDKYVLFKSLYLVDGVPVECLLATFCKVCVAMFLILSGFGLTKSYSSYEVKTLKCSGGTITSNIKSDCIYIKNRLIKLLSDYWFIYIVFVPIGLFFGRELWKFYGYNPINYISDFLGISYLIHNNLDYTMNDNWWYMSACIVYYIIFPILYKLYKRLSIALFFIAFFINLLHPFPAQLGLWIAPFVLGIVLAKEDVFEIIGKLYNRPIYNYILCFSLLILSAYIRRIIFNDVRSDFFFGFSIILTSFLVISKIPVLSKLLEEFGKYSGMIYMFHSFIIAFYFKKFTYCFKYSLLIFVVSLIICYTVARLLKYLEHVIKYDKLIKRMVMVKNEKN